MLGECQEGPVVSQVGRGMSGDEAGDVGLESLLLLPLLLLLLLLLTASSSFYRGLLGLKGEAR